MRKIILEKGDQNIEFESKLGKIICELTEMDMDAYGFRLLDS